MTRIRAIATAVLTAIFLCSLCAELVAPAAYETQFREVPNALPDSRFLLGTDDLGRDRFSRLVYGTRISLLLAPAAALLSTAVAALTGGLAGYLGGWLEKFTLAAADLFLSLPWLFLLLTARAMLPLNISPLVSVIVTFTLLGLLGWAAPARIICAGARSLRESDFLLAARAHGCRQSGPVHLAPRAEPEADLASAVLGFYSALYLERGKSRFARARSRRAAAVMGQPASRTRKLPCGTRQPLDACSRGSAGSGRELLSLSLSLSGVFVVIHRVCLLLLLVSLLVPGAIAQSGGELSFTLGAEPKTFNPLLVADEPSETIRYLTAGVLIRVNRKTQEPEPELATSWRISDGGRKIRLVLRKNVRFSDGKPFTADDVAFTFKKLLDPDLVSPVGDSFRSSAGPVEVETTGTHSLVIVFPAPVAGLELLFDEAAILSSRAEKPESAVLGPFKVAEHKAGSYILLRRNEHYWKRDTQGRRLPYLEAVRLVIQRNRQIETLRFRRGKFHLINGLEPETYDRLAGTSPLSVYDAGPFHGLGNDLVQPSTEGSVTCIQEGLVSVAGLFGVPYQHPLIAAICAASFIADTRFLPRGRYHRPTNSGTTQP